VAEAQAAAQQQAVKFATPLGRSLYQSLFRPAAAGRHVVREMFQPRRTAFVFESVEGASDVPTTLRRSKADCPPVQVGEAGEGEGGGKQRDWREGARGGGMQGDWRARARGGGMQGDWRARAGGCVCVRGREAGGLEGLEGSGVDAHWLQAVRALAGWQHQLAGCRGERGRVVRQQGALG